MVVGGVVGEEDEVVLGMQPVVAYGASTSMTDPACPSIATFPTTLLQSFPTADEATAANVDSGAVAAAAAATGVVARATAFAISAKCGLGCKGSGGQPW